MPQLYNHMIGLYNWAPSQCWSISIDPSSIIYHLSSTSHSISLYLFTLNTIPYSLSLFINYISILGHNNFNIAGAARPLSHANRTCSNSAFPPSRPLHL